MIINYLTNIKLIKIFCNQLIIRESLVQAQLGPLKNQRVTKNIRSSFLFSARFWSGFRQSCKPGCKPFYIMNASISVVLYKSKTLANGENPLLVQVSKDGKCKYKSLGLKLSQLSQFIIWLKANRH